LLELLFSPEGDEDYEYWRRHDRQMLRRINRLIQATQLDPFAGIGKPEPLRYSLAGLWSRRLDRIHRLVYEVTDSAIIVHQCRGHY
jgi:toxin YoeB